MCKRRRTQKGKSPSQTTKLTRKIEVSSNTASYETLAELFVKHFKQHPQLELDALEARIKRRRGKTFHGRLIREINNLWKNDC